MHDGGNLISSDSVAKSLDKRLETLIEAGRYPEARSPISTEKPGNFVSNCSMILLLIEPKESNHNTIFNKKDLLISVLPNVLFEALTNSDKLVQYYPLKEVVSTWKVGDEIILKGSNGGKDFIDYGKIEILSPDKKISIPIEAIITVQIDC